MKLAKIESEIILENLSSAKEEAGFRKDLTKGYYKSRGERQYNLHSVTLEAAKQYLSIIRIE